MYNAILNLYRRNRITKSAVASAVQKGVITADQYADITGEAYPA
jgi:hypothetical protein